MNQLKVTFIKPFLFGNSPLFEIGQIFYLSSPNGEFFMNTDFGNLRFEGLTLERLGFVTLEEK